MADDKVATRTPMRHLPDPKPTPTRDVGFGSGSAPPRWHPDSPEYERQQEEWLQKVYGKNPKTGRHYTDRPAKKGN